MTRSRGLAALALLLSLAGCGHGSTQEVVKRAEHARTRAELERALGKPDHFESGGIGPFTLETWTYKTSDGEVVFVITGDTVALKSASAGKGP